MTNAAKGEVMPEPVNLREFEPNDADICLRIATRIERRNPESREDRLIITALRFLAQRIQTESSR